jgi:hypothetical protein
MVIITSVWKELGYFWFRWRGVLNGPYRCEADAKDAIKAKKQKAKPKPLEEGWRP